MPTISLPIPMGSTTPSGTAPRDVLHLVDNLVEVRAEMPTVELVDVDDDGRLLSRSHNASWFPDWRLNATGSTEHGQRHRQEP